MSCIIDFCQMGGILVVVIPGHIPGHSYLLQAEGHTSCRRILPMS